MSKNNNVLELIKHINDQTIPSSWSYAVKRIKEDETHLDKLLNVDTPPMIYGVNTLVGHLDHVNITDEDINAFQTYLLNNHMLGGTESYSTFEIECINYLKMHDLSLGGSGISLSLYNHLLTLIEKGLFNVTDVPKNASYSCGDVIPGAHWAYGVTDLLRDNFSYELQRKEGLSLINGSYIHVGLSVARLIAIKPIWALYNYNSLEYVELLKIKQSNYSKHMTTNDFDSILYPLEWANSRASINGEQKVQDPMSIRSYPQVASAFSNSIVSFTQSIDEQLKRRSDNPLIVHEEDESLSQASMIAPMISLSTGQLIESMLLAMWQIERRLHFLLGGTVENIPQNGSSEDDPLGLIQVPKLVSAILEETRLKAGRRTFASGSSTSYGTEDIWSNGLSTLDTLEMVTDNMNKILAIELSVILKIREDLGMYLDDYEGYQDDVFRQDYQDKEKENMRLELPIVYDLYPFN